jgi:hypothetical protein
MSLLFRLRRRLAGFLLRGRLLDLWVGRKIRCVEDRYQAELVARSKAPFAKPAPRLPLKRQPNRILLISDFQWEGKELVPELEKICPTDAFNLQPFFAAGAVESRHLAPREVLVKELGRWISQHKEPHPDVILFYARPALLSREAFDLIRRTFSCPVLGMNLDDKIQYLNYGVFSDQNDNYEQWAPCFDLNLTNVRAVVDWYKASGCPVYYMPEGYHPKTDPPEGPPAYRREIAFVGSWRAERAELHGRLRRFGVPLEMFGWGWPNAQEGSAPEAIYRSSMMTLGIGFASPSKVLTTLKTRDFECPGSGACYLTTFNWELALHYEIGKEILCYRSVEEIVELFSFYRRRPDECWRIAQSAYRRCINEHTWEKRFRKLFEEVGITSAI